jgi:hypothetical protein
VLEIEADGRTMFGDNRLHRFGLFVQKKGLQGWRGLPAGRREALARAVEHGEHDVPTFLPSRIVTIDGLLVAKSEAQLEDLSDFVTGIGATGKRFRTVVKSRGATRWADGRRLLCEADEERGGLLEAEFQLQMVFADPRRYGRTNVLPGDTLDPRNPDATATSIAVFSRGNFPAYPLIEIPSAPAGYTVRSPGGVFAVSGATAGGTHTVDLRRGRVYRNGVEMPGVGHGNLWAVPVGTSWTHTLSVPGRVRIDNTYV